MTWVINLKNVCRGEMQSSTSSRVVYVREEKSNRFRRTPRQGLKTERVSRVLRTDRTKSRKTYNEVRFSHAACAAEVRNNRTSTMSREKS